MNRLGKRIYENKNGYGVYAVYMQDPASTRISVEMYTVSPSGVMSDLITVSRRDLIRKKTLDFFLDLDGDFSYDDILSIQKEAVKNLKNAQMEMSGGKYPLAGMQHTVNSYIRNNAKELQANPDAAIFIRDGFGYIRTDCMDKFVKEHPELGYTRVEILKRLKIMGVLKNAPKRPYDVLVSINNKKMRFCKIILADESKREEKPDEVINYGH